MIVDSYQKTSGGVLLNSLELREVLVLNVLKFAQRNICVFFRRNNNKRRIENFINIKHLRWSTNRARAPLTKRYTPFNEEQLATNSVNHDNLFKEVGNAGNIQYMQKFNNTSQT